LNYIGSKHSLIDFIVDTIDSVTNIEDTNDKIFADLFAGTGVVGLAFKKKGYKILSNDIQNYSYILNKHYLESNHNKNNIQILDYLNNIEGVNGFIYNNYCAGSNSNRNYFTDYNGKKCDAIRMKIEELYNENKIDKSDYYHFLASLINSIDKYANTAAVYGAFLKHIKKSANKKFNLEILPIINGQQNNKVYNEEIETLIYKVEGDILYLDPPYNARQYCSNYHILETIARYDNPKLKGKTGLRDSDEQKSKFCSKRMVENEFIKIIKNANFKYIFLSYNNEGLMSTDMIKDVMQNFGEYKVYTKEYRRFRADKENSRNHKANMTKEYIHCLIK